MEKLNFYLVTDLHHYASCFAKNTPEARASQKCMDETGAILDAAFAKMAADPDIDIILIAGDVSNNGEKESHLELIPKLQSLQNAGKRVFLITATHDFKNETGSVYPDGKKATPTKREELYDLYHAFGHNEAIAEDRPSFSYVVQLADGYRLLCLNDDSNGKGRSGYTPETLQWIRHQIQAAHDAGDYIFAMQHHPMLPPSPIYPVISKKDMVGDCDRLADLLADDGLEFLFTGHTHMMNVAVHQSAQGNKIYDINTSSLVGYPCSIRKVTLDENNMDIRTETLEDFDWDRGGKAVDVYLRDKFDALLNGIFDAAAYDIDRLAVLAKGFSVRPDTIYKLKVPIQAGGKFFNRLTIGGLGRLLFFSHKLDPSIKHIRVRDLIVELVRNIYRGDEPYTPGTPIHTAVSLFIQRITPIVKRTKKSSDILRILHVIQDGVLYNTPPADRNVTLPRAK